MMMTSNTTQGTSTTQATGSSFIATFTNGGPSTHAQVTDTPTDRYMIFTDADVSHNFTVPAGGLICDILMIGGGGRSATNGGGGAGACIVARNLTLTAGTCIVWVGSGSTGGSGGGGSSYILTNISTIKCFAQGGGDAGPVNSGGISGGCGGGAGQNFDTSAEGGGAAVQTNEVNGTSIGPTGPTTNGLGYAVLGNAGGDNSTVNGRSGSGGGIGAAGTAGGDGGAGLNQVSINGTIYNFKTWFANGGTFGHNNNGYIGGGGAGYMGNLVFKAGGIGGGGAGTAGAANTGGGGGSNGTNNGGSGIIIIRYRSTTTTTTYTHTPTSTTTLTTTLGTPSIELVRGTQGDSNTDYKIGNYNGDFIVKSSVSGVDSDYIRMLGTNGAIYNFTNSLYWTQTSDRRIKENIARASYDMCYDNIDKLELNRFNYIKEFNTGNKDTNQLGFIAQEIKEIFPKAVFTNNYSGADLNIQDMLSIDIGQINYTLYGAVKKLMEINKDKEMRLKRLEGLLNIEDGSGSSGNVVVDSSNVVVDSSNVVIDSSNMVIDSSNAVVDSSNVVVDSSNAVVDSSNFVVDSSNVVIDSSNVVVDTSNITIDTSNLLDTPNIAIDTSNLLDTSSNIVIDTINLLDTSNIAIDTSNLLDTSSNILDTSSNI